MCMYNDCSYCWYSSLYTCHYWYKAFCYHHSSIPENKQKTPKKTHTHPNMKKKSNSQNNTGSSVVSIDIAIYLMLHPRHPPCIIIELRTNHQSTGAGRLTQPQSQLGSLQNPVSSQRVAWWGFPLNDWDTPQYIYICSIIPKKIINQKNM